MNRKELLLKEEKLQKQAKQEIDAWMKSDMSENLFLFGISLDNVIEYLEKSHKVYQGSYDSCDNLGCSIELYSGNKMFVLNANFEDRSYIEIKLD